MHSDIGFLKIDGHLFPVRHITLQPHGLRLNASHHGEHPGCTGLIQLFDADGHPIIGEGMDQTQDPVTVPRMWYSDDHLSITYNLNFAHVPILRREWKVSVNDVIQPKGRERRAKHRRNPAPALW
jgi:hypothetical protein